MNVNWVVIVDLGGPSTHRYLLRGFSYADARARGERMARQAATDPVLYCDVYAVAEGDPSVLSLTPDKVSLVCCEHRDAEHFFGPTSSGGVGRWCRGHRMSGGRRGIRQQCGCSTTLRR